MCCEKAPAFGVDAKALVGIVRVHLAYGGFAELRLLWQRQVVTDR